MTKSPTPPADLKQDFPVRTVKAPSTDLALQQDLFKKAVEIVHSIPRTKLTLLQCKLNDAMLKHAARSKVCQDGFYEVKIKDIAETVGFNSQKHPSYLKNALLKLMDIRYEWNVLGTDTQFKASVLFPEVELTRSVLRYQISNQMRPFVTNPTVYAYLDTETTKRFERLASYHLYQFCNRFVNIGVTALVPWELLRDIILGADSGKGTYSEYRYFMNRQLKPAIKEVNRESSIEIEVDTDKDGLQVTGLQFRVRRKDTIDAEPPRVMSESFLKLESEMRELGLTTKECREISRDHTEDMVRQALAYTRKRMANTKLEPLSKPGAYFKGAVKKGYAGEMAPLPSPAAQPSVEGSRFDLQGAFEAQRARDARGYFEELDEELREELVERYNEQCSSPEFRIKKRKSKVAQTAFLNWLAKDTWGEPSTDDLLRFAESLLGKRS